MAIKSCCLTILIFVYGCGVLSFRISTLRTQVKVTRNNKVILMASTSGKLSNNKNDPSSFTVAVLGDLHLDPRYMDDHIAGQKHFEPIVKRKSTGEPRKNTCVVSLGDLGESASISPDTSELFSGTTACFELAREYLDGFGVPFEVIGGNHDLEGIDEFPTDQANLEAYLRILGKPTPQFKRLIAEKTMLVGLGSTVFRNARYTSHEVFIDDEQVYCRLIYTYCKC